MTEGHLWIGFFLVAALLVSSCGESPGRRSPLEFPYEEVAEGDLAFRCGPGMHSRVVTFAEEKGIYSHCGIIVKDGDSWKVVHAVPGEKEHPGDFDRVKAESLEQFFSERKAVKGCLVHTGLSDSASVRAIGRKAMKAASDSIRFDAAYDLEDSTALYCTELLWRLYREQGVDLSEGKRRHVNAFRIKGEVILPEHLLDYSGNEIYFLY